ncbi:MAG TPA: DUF2752 domain-containing protein [Candidatus Hydrogenedentes bacterium]|nr:DUF2752 domain-containing protein [Candidatus Hydrogenedentota bacterium]HOL76358.1 DUF2752 domain-containing protein [Candidatus Hydrogenedentota bacterium]HPO85396.1 DUF2752 domain-containing protein [Candidatus Hydrogenedentota bacterium]
MNRDIKSSSADDEHEPIASREKQPTSHGNWPFLSALSAAILVGSMLIAPEQLPNTSLCAFRTITGKPCPACGLTHSFCAISRGELEAAWHYNPFGFVFYAGALLILFSPVLHRWDTRFMQRVVEFCLRFRLGALLLIAMILFGLARIWGY